MHGSDQELNINILFGNACNMKCRYCLQEEGGQTHKGDLQYFLNNFKKYLSSVDRPIRSIHYWGGETLLYQGSVKKVIEELLVLRPEIQLHRITTNATLINEEYVEFCNSHPSILTVVSLHEFDLPEQQQKIIGNLNWMNLSGVLHHQMPTPSSYYYEWYDVCKKMGKTIPLAVFPMHATDGAHPDTWLTEEDVDQFFNEMIFKIMPLANSGDVFAKGVLSNFIFYCKKQFRYPAAPKCHNHQILSVDLFGNTYACHHNNAAKYIIGNIFDEKKIIPIYNPHSDRYFSSDECQNCEAMPMCRGSCYLSNTHDIDCHWHKLFYLFWQYIKPLLK